MTYGCLKPDNMVLYVNLIGDLMQLFYIVVYHTYAEDKVVLPHFPTLPELIIPLPSPSFLFPVWHQKRLCHSSYNRVTHCSLLHIPCQ